MQLDLEKINADIGHDAERLVEWALSLDRKAIVRSGAR